MFAGLGVSMVPRFLVDKDIEAGRLSEINLTQETAKLGVYFMMPQRRQITAAARAFVDFVSGRVRKALG